MSTLFQLNSNLHNLKEKLTEIATLWVEGDGVILLGETVAFSEWMFSYIDYDENSYDADDEVANAQESNAKNPNTEVQENTNAQENEEEGIDWFALQSDIDSLNSETQSKLTLDAERLIILSDSEWVSLTREYDRVMTVSI